VWLNSLQIDNTSLNESIYLKNYSENNKFTYALNKISLSIDKEDWIKMPISDFSNKTKPFYSISGNQNTYFASNQHISFADEISFAWNLSDLFKVNLDFFRNQYQNDFNNFFKNSQSAIKSFNTFSKIAALPPTTNSQLDINRSLTGYKLGISSELGLGRDYKLGINIDYGLLDGADLVGFTNNEVTTSSFELGIRNRKFGASVNTDIYMEDNVDFMQNSRMGFELDWHFSDETKISVGSKQRFNNNVQSSSLDNLTGNIQYIKFQHNL